MVECIRLTERHVASFFDQLDSRGEIVYRFLLVAMDETSWSIVCAIAVEESPGMKALASLPPAVLEALNLGTQVLGLWDGKGRSAVDIGRWPTLEAFKTSALPMVRRAIGLEELAK